MFSSAFARTCCFEFRGRRVLARNPSKTHAVDIKTPLPLTAYDSYIGGVTEELLWKPLQLLRLRTLLGLRRR